MPSKRDFLAAFLPGLLLLLASGVARAELSTLFTTPQERQIINANRYKSDEVRPVRPLQNQDAVEPPVAQLLKEEVTREYRITGISISPEGAHTVWINSAIYEDGAQLEDKSRIKVLVGNEIRVRITAPDGKQYFATSGEKLQVTYLAPIEN